MVVDEGDPEGLHLGKSDIGRSGTAIETRRRPERRVRIGLPLAYAAGWGGLLLLSSMHWFLPAGLRLATLWFVPRRHWWRLALGEFAVGIAIFTARGAFDETAPLIASAIVPWCLYALIVRFFATSAGAAPTPESMMRFLLCGLGAAIANAIVTTLVLRREFAFPGDVPTVMLGFALGDYIGILVVAPLLRIVLAQYRGRPAPLRDIFAKGWVVVPIAVAVAGVVLPGERSNLYPVMLSVFPLLWIANRYGWRPAAIALSLLSIGVHGMDTELFRQWSPVQLQLLLAVSGSGALTLGISGEALRAQGRALTSSIDMLSRRTRALADAANRLVTQQELERHRIGAELHDQLGQDMTAIATRLRLVERATDSDAVRDGLQSIQTLVGEAHDHLRETIQSLHPLVLDRFGLARALADGPMNELAADHGIDYECVVEGPVDALPDGVATALYRICQEATTNAVRHGCGGRLRIRLALVEHPAARDVTLAIDDDGGAFEIPADHAGAGLQNIHDRADAIGAEYRFNPRSGHPRHWLEVRVAE